MAESTRKPQAGPFVKWAGGKSQLLAQYDALLPRQPLRGYYEPFVGSGAVFFHVRNQGRFEHYTLSESNRELINCYEVVRDRLDELIRWLSVHARNHNKDYYYRIRHWDREPDWPHAPRVRRAARMIYLNKTCYNGLWRVNSKGHFNVPIGRYRNPTILDDAGLRAASAVLQGVSLAVADFEAVLQQAKRGDFVYFDPPYYPLTATANFTSYSAHTFGAYEHRKLALVFAELDRRGCQVMLSNSDTPFVRELYRNFRIETVQARRAINSRASQRGKISEVVVLNYS